MKKSQESAVGGEEKTVVVNGIRVNYRIAGQGPVFLILHGWGSSSNSWRKMQVLIVKAGFKVIVPDLPGFGVTPSPKGIWGVHEYEDFVFRFLDVLRIKKCILLGHSFGGQISIQFAISHPERIEKLILVSPAVVRHKPGWRSHVFKYAAKLVGAALYVTPSNIGSNIRRGMYALLRRPDYIHANGVMKDIFKKVIHQDLSQVVQQISVPTLLLWGKRDRMTSIEDGKLVAQKISGVIFTVFPENGHNLHAEDPQKLAEKIKEFLQ